MKSIEDYGPIYTGRDGNQYVKLTADGFGVAGDGKSVPFKGFGARVDVCKTFEGVVQSFVQVDPAWWEVSLKNGAKYLVSNNWLEGDKDHHNPPLRPDEQVEGLANTLSNGVWRIERKSKEAEAVV